MYVVTVDEELCTGCGDCVNACPAEIFKVENGTCVASNDECLGCLSCVAICQVDAVKVDEY